MLRHWLPYLAWTAVICLLVALALWIALKWLAVRIARRVADLAERRLAATVQAGLSHPSLKRRRAVDPGDGHESEDADDPQRRERYLKEIDRLARLMDGVIPLPIVGGIGLDAVLGLIPVAGDAISFAISSFIVIRAAQLGVPESLISRLVAIQMTDLILGSLPVAGDVFDAAYHADEKSAALIRQHVEARRQVDRQGVLTD